MASVFLGDLDDFIAPSQACVNPLFATAATGGGSGSGTTAGSGDGGRAPMELVLEDELDAPMALAQPPPQQEPDLIKTSAAKTATVTLNDCLACSGCVTSAETVLITQQSAARLLSLLRDGAHAVRVASLSPQSRASLADYYNMPPADAHARAAAFLTRLGFTHVLDAAIGGDLSLVAAAEEFTARMRARAAAAPHPPSPPPWAPPPRTTAISKTTRLDVASGRVERVPAAGAGAAAAEHMLPVLASACPGFVCYAEKAAPEALAYLSAAVSPQAAVGALVKGPAARAWNVPPGRVLHVSVQPCFDRKLEASRRDFYDADADSTDVDVVLSTAELLDMIREAAGGEAQAAQYFRSLPPQPPPIELAPGIPLPTAASPNGVALALLASEDAARGASGGYAEHVLRNAARSLYGVTVPRGGVEWRRGRNADLSEAVLEVGGGAPPLRFARAYGFRNIQAILSQLRRRRCQYDYVEVMACPGGCVNGGGQVRPPQEVPAATRERTARVAAAMQTVPALPEPEASPLVLQMLGAGGAMRVALAATTAAATAAPSCAEHAPSPLHTTYHAVPKLEANALLAPW